LWFEDHNEDSGFREKQVEEQEETEVNTMNVAELNTDEVSKTFANRLK
jgi:hypothetical protein